MAKKRKGRKESMFPKSISSEFLFDFKPLFDDDDNDDGFRKFMRKKKRRK